MAPGVGNHAGVVVAGIGVAVAGAAHDGLERARARGSARDVEAAALVVLRLAGIVAGSKEADVVGVALAEVLVHHVGHVAGAVVRPHLRAPAVAHHHGLALAVGIVAYLLEGIGNVGRGQVLDAGQVEVGTRGHAAIGGGTVVGRDSDIAAVDDHTRAASRRAGVGAVVLTAVVGGGAAAGDRGVLAGRSAIVHIGALDAAAQAGILESDVLKVDASVDHTQHHALAVVDRVDAQPRSVERAGEHIVGMGGRAGRIGGLAHDRRHVDTAHAGQQGHSLDRVDRHQGGEQSVVEGALHLHSLGLKAAHAAAGSQANEAGHILAPAHLLGLGIDAHGPRHVARGGHQAAGHRRRLLGLLLRGRRTAVVEKHLCRDRQLASHHSRVGRRVGASCDHCTTSYRKKE